MWFENLLTFIELGARHVIPMGLDHMLFVAGLALSVTAWRPLLVLVTGFTFAHSLSLALATFDLVSIPSPLVEAGIALSIMVVGVELLFDRADVRIKFAIVFLFGLVHGLGFATMIKGYLLGGDLITGLVGFNIGVELAQLVVVAVVGGLALAVRSGLRSQGLADWYQRAFIWPCAAGIILAGAAMLLSRTGLVAGWDI